MEFLIQFSPPPIPFGNREDDASRAGSGILESTLQLDCGDALLNQLQIKKRGWNETSRFSFAPLQNYKIASAFKKKMSAFPHSLAPQSASKQRSNFEAIHLSGTRLEMCK